MQKRSKFGDTSLWIPTSNPFTSNIEVRPILNVTRIALIERIPPLMQNNPNV